MRPAGACWLTSSAWSHLPRPTALYQHIRAEKITAQPVSVTLPTFLSSQTPPIEVDQPVFVARETEFARLDQFLNQACASHGQVIFVTGEPGSGKTMLVQEFARRTLVAYPDLIVVSGNCNATQVLAIPTCLS